MNYAVHMLDISASVKRASFVPRIQWVTHEDPLPLKHHQNEKRTLFALTFMFICSGVLHALKMPQPREYTHTANQSNVWLTADSKSVEHVHSPRAVMSLLHKIHSYVSLCSFMRPRLCRCFYAKAASPNGQKIRGEGEENIK